MWWVLVQFKVHWRHCVESVLCTISNSVFWIILHMFSLICNAMWPLFTKGHSCTCHGISWQARYYAGHIKEKFDIFCVYFHLSVLRVKYTNLVTVLWCAYFLHIEKLMWSTWCDLHEIGDLTGFFPWPVNKILPEGRLFWYHRFCN